MALNPATDEEEEVLAVPDAKGVCKTVVMEIAGPEGKDCRAAAVDTAGPPMFAVVSFPELFFFLSFVYFCFVTKIEQSWVFVGGNKRSENASPPKNQLVHPVENCRRWKYRSTTPRRGEIECVVKFLTIGNILSSKTMIVQNIIAQKKILVRWKKWKISVGVFKD